MVLQAGNGKAKGKKQTEITCAGFSAAGREYYRRKGGGLLKKKISLSLLAAALAALLLLSGCGEGAGAEDTGKDGKVGNTSRTTLRTTAMTSPATSMK